jgi:hypothetical protein
MTTTRRRRGRRQINKNLLSGRFFACLWGLLLLVLLTAVAVMGVAEVLLQPANEGAAMAAHRLSVPHCHEYRSTIWKKRKRGRQNAPNRNLAPGDLASNHKKARSGLELELHVLLYSCQRKHSPLPELELELIQAHMAQKLLLWVEVGAHAVRKRPFLYFV